MDLRRRGHAPSSGGSSTFPPSPTWLRCPISSDSSVAKKLSTTALSQQFPFRLMLHGILCRSSRSSNALAPGLAQAGVLDAKRDGLAQHVLRSA